MLWTNEVPCKKFGYKLLKAKCLYSIETFSLGKSYTNCLSNVEGTSLALRFLMSKSFIKRLRRKIYICIQTIIPNPANLVKMSHAIKGSWGRHRAVYPQSSTTQPRISTKLYDTEPCIHKALRHRAVYPQSSTTQSRVSTKLYDTEPCGYD